MSVVLAHRNAAVASSLALMLRAHGSLSVAASVSRTEDILPAVQVEQPLLALVDPLLPGLDLSTFVRDVERVAPGAGVAVMAGVRSMAFLRVAVESGARAFLSLNLPVEELVRDLELAAAGQVVVSNPAADSLADLVSRTLDRPAVKGLSGREIEVVHWVAQGSTNRQIAEALTLTENTVKVHLRNIFQKLELRNRHELIAYAHRQGLAPHAGPGTTP